MVTKRSVTLLRGSGSGTLASSSTVGGRIFGFQLLGFGFRLRFGFRFGF